MPSSLQGILSLLSTRTLCRRPCRLVDGVGRHYEPGKETGRGRNFQARSRQHHGVCDLAQSILEDLATGKDPTNGQSLPTGGPLHTPYVMQALYLGAMALARSQSQQKLKPASTGRRSRQKRQIDPDAPRSGKRWLPDEDGRLLAAYGLDHRFGQAARAHEVRHRRSAG